MKSGRMRSAWLNPARRSEELPKCLSENAKGVEITVFLHETEHGGATEGRVQCTGSC